MSDKEDSKDYFIVGWFSLEGGFRVVGTSWKVAELVEKSRTSSMSTTPMSLTSFNR
jgi:hypothetical protein